MIFIVVKFTVLEEHSARWLTAVEHFTEHTRSEPGNLWFEWNSNIDNPHQYVLVEAFADAEAGADHVASEHFAAGLETMRPLLSRTPQIINTVIDRQDWSDMGELTIERSIP